MTNIEYRATRTPYHLGRKTLDGEGLAIGASLVDFTIKAVGKVGAIL